MKKFISKSINFAFGLMMSIVFVLILFFQKADYITKKNFLLPNWCIILLIFGFALFLLGIFYFYKKNSTCLLKKINTDNIVIIFSFILFLSQCFVFYNIFFLTDWDVRIIRENAQYIAEGNLEAITSTGSNYFSTYPNNLLLTFINAFLFKLNSSLGIFHGDYATMCCVIVNCILNTLSCLLVYKTLAVFCEKKFAFIGYIIGVLLFGISPWSIIFYSDSVGIIFPILSIYLYTKPNKTRNLNIVSKFFSILTSVVGYFIKPQCAIVLIALIIIEFLESFNKFDIKKLLKPASVILASLICFCTINTAINFTAKKTGYVIDENRKLGATHFFMMGLNTEAGGAYSQEDINYSRSFATVKERQKANLEVAFNRIQDLKIKGLSKHIGKKLLLTFNDGTFAWGVDGTFFKILPEKIDTKMSRFLKSVYYRDGSRYDYFHLFAQTIWIFVLMFNFVCVFKKSSKKEQKQINILKLSLLGLFLFEALFEVRARYLYTYAPFFCMVATVGIAGFFTKINSFTEKRIIKR